MVKVKEEERQELLPRIPTNTALIQSDANQVQTVSDLKQQGINVVVVDI